MRHLLQQLEPVRLNGEIVQQLQALDIHDTGLGAGDNLDDAAAWTSCLGVPLLNAERVAGALILANPRRAETFDESHERILGAVAAQLAAAMGQAAQFEQSRQITLATQTRAAQLSLLSEAAAVMASAPRSAQANQLVLDQLQRLIPYDSASLWRRDGAEGPWQLAALRGQSAGAGRPGQLSDLAQPENDPLAEVVSTRSSLVIADAGQDSRFAGRQPRPGAWLGFPLAHQGQLLGVIAVERAAPHSYGAAQAALALAFASQAAVTLANVRQYEDGLRRAFELDQRAALLNRASASLGRAVEPRDVLLAALQALTEALGVPYGAALLFDEAGANASVAARLPAGPVDASGLPPGANVLLDQLRTQLAPVAAANVAADRLVGPDYAAWIGPDIQTALFLPLAVAGRLIGLIGLGDNQAREPFSVSRLELAMTLANQAALAAQNTRLYRLTQRRLTELAAITQSSQSLSQALDLQPVFANVCDQVAAALHADSFFVALYDAASRQLSFPLAVEHGQRVELSPRAPGLVIGHVLATRQSLVLIGDIGSQLAELGLLPAGSGEAAGAGPGARQGPAVRAVAVRPEHRRRVGH